jgi:CRP-like cAMP-binding protein
MRLDQLAIPLLRHEIFHGLKPLQITEIVRRAERTIFLPGQVMMRAGEMGDGAILVFGGDARMSGDGAWGLDDAAVPSGALLGEMCMLIEQEHGITVVAETMVRGLKILRSTMHELMLDDPGLAHHFSHRISRRLARVADELRRIDDTMADAYHLPL